MDSDRLQPAGVRAAVADKRPEPGPPGPVLPLHDGPHDPQHSCLPHGGTQVRVQGGGAQDHCQPRPAPPLPGGALLRVRPGPGTVCPLIRLPPGSSALIRHWRQQLRLPPGTCSSVCVHQGAWRAQEAGHVRGGGGAPPGCVCTLASLRAPLPKHPRTLPLSHQPDTGPLAAAVCFAGGVLYWRCVVHTIWHTGLYPGTQG
mmetsp:Transcript_24208/g.52908  ORF Transcript_24208/g.52908 Transcript_24208/m.52908 type:complete len:201 (-) Transcript_24208:412-1014(-)